MNPKTPHLSRYSPARFTELGRISLLGIEEHSRARTQPGMMNIRSSINLAGSNTVKKIADEFKLPFTVRAPASVDFGKTD